MGEPRSTGDPHRPHDRLWTVYAQLRDGFDAMEGGIDLLIAAGARGPDAGVAALEPGHVGRPGG